MLIPSFLGVIFQSTCNLNGMPNNFMNSLLKNQLHGILMNGIPFSLGNIYSEVQGNLVGFPNMTMGAWNLLQ
jgi:hypothetical protein